MPRMPFARSSVRAFINGHPRRGPLAIAAMVAGLVLGACQNQRVVPLAGADHSIVTEYSWGSLSANLPPEMGVLTVGAAAESALRGRGYVIDAASGTKDHVEVIGRASVHSGLDTVHIESALTPTGTSICISVGMFGDQSASRAILDDVLSKLGR